MTSDRELKTRNSAESEPIKKRSIKFQSKKKQKEIREKRREDIILNLPDFINQILLLMDSGLIVQDAFRNVGRGYLEIAEDKRGYFRNEIVRIVENSELSRTDVINGFYEFALRNDVKELTKTANFLYENKNRGTELWERLSELSEGLWEERKRLCIKKIRVSETKMSFPLGIMLIALILMTSAPALLQIK